MCIRDSPPPLCPSPMRSSDIQGRRNWYWEKRTGPSVAPREDLVPCCLERCRLVCSLEFWHPRVTAFTDIGMRIASLSPCDQARSSVSLCYNGRDLSFVSIAFMIYIGRRRKRRLLLLVFDQPALEIDRVVKQT